MLNILFLVVLLVGAWFLWSSWDRETGSFDFKKGLAGLAAVGGAIAAWFSTGGTTGL